VPRSCRLTTARWRPGPSFGGEVIDDAGQRQWRSKEML